MTQSPIGLLTGSGPALIPDATPPAGLDLFYQLQYSTAQSLLASGATVEEMIPGDLAAMERASTSAGAAASLLADSRRGIRDIQLDGADWSGEARVAYETVKDEDLTVFATSVRAFDEAESTLDTYIRAVREGRLLAAAARREYGAGLARQASSVIGVHGLTCPAIPLAPLAPGPTPAGACADPGGDPFGLHAATVKLVEAQTSVSQAGDAAATAMNALASTAPGWRPPMPAPRPDSIDDHVNGFLKGLVMSPVHLVGGYAKEMYDNTRGLPDRLEGKPDPYAEDATRAEGEMLGGGPGTVALLPGAGEALSVPAETLLGRIATRLVASDGSRGAPGLLSVGDVKLPAVPKCALGTPTQTGKGMEYAIPPGTPEISEKVASVRIMDPVTSGRYEYPRGYAVYMNSSGQTINPLTGQTLARADPFAHIPLP